MMRKSISSIALCLILLPLVSMFGARAAHAATLSSAKDTISTSRPSAAWYLSGDYASTDTIVSISANTTQRYLASDSARLISGNGTVLGSALIVASQSADLKTVYLANSGGTAAKTPSDILIDPVTAKHTVTFTTINAIPSGGFIKVTFPGAGTSVASPSATMFSFNGLTTGNVSLSGAGSCSVSGVTPPTVTVTCASGLAANSTPVITIGSTSPALINPTKSNTAGSNDSWRIILQTTDSSGIVVDDAKVGIATIDSVKVTADVDPSISFTIAPISGAFSAAAGCTGGDSTIGTPSSTATEVSLGFLRSGAINIAGQLLTVATNGASGYAISATSSGHMINPATGYWLRGANLLGATDPFLSANDTPAPAGITAGTEAFGISACGAAVSTGLWGDPTSCTTAAGTCKYSNPWNGIGGSFYATIASYTGGPVTASNTNANTAIKYAGTVSGSTPPGSYRTIFTYVATATF